MLLLMPQSVICSVLTRVEREFAADQPEILNEIDRIAADVPLSTFITKMEHINASYRR
jgi:hypothetical protein